MEEAKSQCINNGSDQFWSENWISCDSLSNPTNPGVSNFWILYDLSQIYLIDSLHLYNLNTADTLNGVRDFELHSSFDGITWDSQGAYTCPMASNTAGYSGTNITLQHSFQARYVVLTALSNYGGDCYGLSEVILGVDTVSCRLFTPSLSIEYNLCSEQFNLAVDNLDSFSSVQFKWSNGAETSSIQSSDEGVYHVIASDPSCTQIIETDVSKPAIRESGWASGEIIPDGSFLFANPLFTSGLAKNSDRIHLYNPSSVVLEQEFVVQKGSNFSIAIIDCENQPEQYYLNERAHPLSTGYAYYDYLGGGHSYGIHSTDGGSTVSGGGLLSASEAYRFLNQASFGANMEEMALTRHLGYEEWIDWQLTIPHESYFNHLSYRTRFAPRILYWLDWHRTWWQNVLTGNQYLRDRMAFALSQIFVISSNSLLRNFADGLTSYYDLLSKHAFGSYRDLLYDVTLHPTMGHYLTHMSNAKTDSSRNQFPDENYAREILQLFSIGLYELNIDGTRKKDMHGNDIPTYSNNEIMQFSRVFTGLASAGRPWGAPVHAIDNADANSYMTVPMVMHEDQHEPGAKYLFNQYEIPAGQTGLEDIAQAIDHIFNHPNVGPFIATRLIQRFVSSHPSPGYVQRVAEIFNNDGQGNRGNLGAVVKAILLDPEARDCQKIADQYHGKLKEPLLRFTQLYKAFELESNQGTFYALGQNIERLTAQAPLKAPSVFNFYTSDYRPPGILSDVMLDAPEFQIFNSTTSIGYVNMVDSIALVGNVLDVEEGKVSFNLSHELSLADNPDMLVEHLNIKLTSGTLQPKTKQIIRQAVQDMSSFSAEQRVKMAIYLIASTPEFAILK